MRLRTGRYLFWRRRGVVWVNGVAQKVDIATSGLAADPVFTVRFMYDGALAAGKTDGDSAAERWQLACLVLRAKYAGGIWRLAEAMARWRTAQVSAIVRLHRYLPCCFQIFYLWLWPISSPDRC